MSETVAAAKPLSLPPEARSRESCTMINSFKSDDPVSPSSVAHAHSLPNSVPRYGVRDLRRSMIDRVLMFGDSHWDNDRCHDSHNHDDEQKTL
jgi:hypothetical protein